MKLDVYSIVFLRRPPDAPKLSDEELDVLQREHIAFNARMREEGHAVITGPVSGQPDESLRGINVFRTSIEETRRLMDADPSVRAGRLVVDVFTWYTPEGLPVRIPRLELRTSSSKYLPMSLTLSSILYLLAFIAFVLAALGWTYRKTDLIAIGLALFTLALLLPNLSSFGVRMLVLLLSFLAFVAAAVGWRYRKINLIAVGLALYMLSLIL